MQRGSIYYSKRLYFQSLHSQINTILMPFVFRMMGPINDFILFFPKQFLLSVCAKMRGKDSERSICINKILNTKRTQFRSILIVDDLIQTGGTLLECASLLKQTFEDVEISVYATHGVFPKIVGNDSSRVILLITFLLPILLITKFRVINLLFSISLIFYPTIYLD